MCTSENKLTFSVRKFRNVFSQAIRKSRNFLLDRSNTKVYLENEQNLENLQKKDTAKAFTKAAVKDKSNILVKGLMNRIDRALMKLSRQNVKKNHEEGKVPMANSQSSADSGSSPAPLVAPSSSHGYRDRFEWRDPQSNYTTISSPAAERKRLEIQKKRFSLIKESHNSGESFGSEEADLSMSASQTTHLNRRPLSSINEYAESTLNFLKHGKSTSSNEGAESHHVESRSRLNRLSIVVTKEVIIEETIRDDPN